MKKIIIISHALEIGGVETSLLGLLENIDTTKYEVDLFLLRHKGELMHHIPKKIHLLPEIDQYASLAIPIVEVIKKKQINIFFRRIVGKYKAKHRIKNLHLSDNNGVQIEYSHKYTVDAMPVIQSEINYNLAISFLTPHYFLDKKVNAKKKIAWIHTDYATIDIDVDSEFKMWSKFDHIVSISNDVTNSFLKVFPTLDKKILMIENIIPMTYLNNLVNAFSVEKEMSSDCIKLLSVGRYTFAKRFDEIPIICKKIRNLGVNVRWYIIGYGGEEELIKNKIKDAKMENFVILLGKKNNPYPYINACDIYVQPSRFEGKSVAVREAQILNKPVIITNYATSKSQLEDGVDGVIVPMDIDGCAAGIVNVIRNQELQKQITINSDKKDYKNKNEINKIHKLIE